MPDLDLNALSFSELKQLQKDVDKAIGTYETRRRAEAKAELESRAKELGFSLSDLLEGPAARKRVSVPKYRNPADPEQTWTGRGRKPGWIAEALAQGKPIEDFEI
ncbi:H-NS histone family protein [Paenirhodobacter populi]|uniref:H-NS histone family protein n=1 Tax=Paenirhodobacter populi TaxID=2306993 RepID=A0A443IPZ7_9RHOB|nr:H-NS histone family protein [Sinirhodobacter populi]RWR07935.1 H-NS histone family protein [Sinirhodobacter populi]RWR08843.1 H-NS histone family protein [Sinirhodobacter populi]RWR23708.1 H-NS histone family protein [Sinirhodobacter populi]RWR30353.1 H-NS histone family protein [Sinirhodobacter populi]RWR32326.1 H-NS histone family protein [Sinirhodobacter populi]